MSDTTDDAIQESIERLKLNCRVDVQRLRALLKEAEDLYRKTFDEECPDAE